MSNKEIADLIFPNVMDVKEILKKYKRKEKIMVTRYAPSPTGFTHFGNIYTAFINYVIAKQNNGICFLRIEDTDQKRIVNNGIQKIIDDLKKFNIIFDEGMIDEENEIGLYGPYRQSKRKEIYQSFIKDMIIKGIAYPCFCTEQDLETIRKVQENNKEEIGYYKKYAKCRNLTNEDIKKKILNNEKYVIRFKSTGEISKKITVADLILGKVEMPENIMDIIIMKSDGLPTYHFAHVIDDYLMGTSIVIRDHNWFTSLPIHYELFKVLNFPIPQYAHIAPVLINDNGTIRKLSKRKDKEAAISYFYENGYPVDAMMIYIATIVNSNFEEWFSIENNNNIYDFKFSLDKISKSGPLFDKEKLNNISRNYIAKMNANDLYNNLVEWAKLYDKELYNLLIKYKEKSIIILNIEREKEHPRKDYCYYKGIKSYIWFMYDELFVNPNYELEIDNKEELENILTLFINNYKDETEDIWMTQIKNICNKLGYATSNKEFKNNTNNYKGNISDIMLILRVAVTSKKITFSLYEIMKILGKKEVINRIEKFLKHIR